MKGRIGKVLAGTAFGLIMSFGTASAQMQTPPASECVENGQVATVELLNGVRYFMCWEGRWTLFRQCIGAPGNQRCTDV